jgi:hypothetical protein
MVEAAEAAELVGFDSETHVYTDKGGRAYDSTTQILAMVGMVDYSMVKKYILERKSQIGVLVHQACEILDRENLTFDELVYQYDIPEAVRPYTAAYYEWKVGVGFVPRLIEERRIASINGMKFGMTLDREGTIPRLGTQPFVIEIKTTAEIENYMGLQMASYDLGLGAPEGFPNRNRAVIQLRANGKFKPEPFDVMQDYDVFRAALVCTWWKRNFS